MTRNLGVLVKTKDRRQISDRRETPNEINATCLEQGSGEEGTHT
jgi:hypothetical protein